MACALDFEVVFSWLDSLLWPWNGFSSAEIGPCDRFFAVHDIFGRAVGDHNAALKSGAGPKVAQPVGLTKGILVVLNDEKGVPQIAQLSEGFEETIVVALVQPNRGFVQHVHHTGQSTANLRRKPDALTFSARKRVCFPVQGEVVQSHAVEESKAAFDFLDDLRTDEHAPVVECFE